MPAHTDGEVVEDPRPLNPLPAYGLLPVIAFPAQELLTYGDLYSLPGDAEPPQAPRDTCWEPGQH